MSLNEELSGTFTIFAFIIILSMLFTTVFIIGGFFTYPIIDVALINALLHFLILIFGYLLNEIEQLKSRIYQLERNKF